LADRPLSRFRSGNPFQNFYSGRNQSALERRHRTPIHADPGERIAAGGLLPDIRFDHVHVIGRRRCSKRGAATTSDVASHAAR